MDKKCRADICADLRNYKINPEKCKGCSKCARNCPVGAITGKIKVTVCDRQRKMYQMWSMFRELCLWCESIQNNRGGKIWDQ